MTTPWVRLWDSTRVPLNSMRNPIVSAIRSTVTARPSRARAYRTRTSAATMSRNARRNAESRRKPLASLVP
jgi:alpha-beta hydrolase superfamily lysophospholipase